MKRPCEIGVNTEGKAMKEKREKPNEGKNFIQRRMEREIDEMYARIANDLRKENEQLRTELEKLRKENAELKEELEKLRNEKKA